MRCRKTIAALSSSAFLLAGCAATGGGEDTTSSKGTRAAPAGPAATNEDASAGGERRDVASTSRGRIPRRPRALARELTRVDRSLKEGIDEWNAARLGRRTPQWRALLETGLRAQKIYRKLVVKPRLARKVQRRVGRALAWKIAANVKAGRGLRALTTPVEPPVRMKTKRPASPRKLLTFYAKADRRFGVPWPILAAINFVESKHGRINGPSSAGARGPMQFMPATWDAYGRGNIMDPHDSIMAAGRYLRASGAPGRMRQALYAYNHSDAYVDAVQAYARQIKADTRNFYGYYLFQVFVRTTEGDKQLTGPGS